MSTQVMLNTKTIKVQNVPTTVSFQTIKEPFAKCGTIASFSTSQEGSTLTASITFDSEKAASIAYNVVNGALIGSQKVVITPVDTPGAVATTSPSVVDKIGTLAVDVLSSLLATGYVVGENALDKAKTLDMQYIGLSTKVANIDQTYHVQEKAKAAADAVASKAQSIDQQYHLSEKVLQNSVVHTAVQKTTETVQVITDATNKKIEEKQHK
jgi:hypothetical protein